MATPRSLCLSASTAPILTAGEMAVASFSHSGARALQCPHQGA